MARSVGLNPVLGAIFPIFIINTTLVVYDQDPINISYMLYACQTFPLYVHCLYVIESIKFIMDINHVQDLKYHGG